MCVCARVCDGTNGKTVYPKIDFKHFANCVYAYNFFLSLFIYYFVQSMRLKFEENYDYVHATD